jgi:hypothetical protein
MAKRGLYSNINDKKKAYSGGLWVRQCVPREPQVLQPQRRLKTRRKLLGRNNGCFWIKRF